MPGLVVQGGTNEIHETELYDYTGGLIETENIALKAPHVVTQLTSQLESTLALTWSTQRGNVSLEGVKPGLINLRPRSVYGRRKLAESLLITNTLRRENSSSQLTGGQKTSVTLNIADHVGYSPSY